jgi:hypothetical protein
MRTDAIRARRVAIAGFLFLSVILSAVGYRLFVDATAAVIYNADQRIAEATDKAWIYASIWGVLNGALAYAAFRKGIFRSNRWLTGIAAASVLVLDLSFSLLLGIRGSAGDLGAAAVFTLVVGLTGLLAWHRPGLGGLLLLVIGGWLTLGSLFNSATYEGEAAGLLFDEDLFFVVSLGLLPLLAGVLFLVCWISGGRPKRG